MGVPDPADGTSLYWKLVARGKRCAVVDLKTDDGRATILRLVEDAHVVIENFRPGTLERLGLGPDVLLERNPKARDPARHRLRAGRPLRRPGRASPRSPRRCRASRRSTASPTAARCCRRSRSPTRSPRSAGAFATMVALWSGEGQVVDVNLLESLFQCMGPLPARVRHHRLPAAAARLGHPVLGAPRHLAVLGRALGRGVHVGGVGRRAGDGPDRLRRPRRPAHVQRPHRRPRRGRRAHGRVLRGPHARRGAARSSRRPTPPPRRSTTWPTSPTDPHYAARGAIVEVDGVPMQGLVARLSKTPGHIRWPGRALGADPPEWATTTSEPLRRSPPRCGPAATRARWRRRLARRGRCRWA